MGVPYDPKSVKLFVNGIEFCVEPAISFSERRLGFASVVFHNPKTVYITGEITQWGPKRLPRKLKKRLKRRGL